MILMTILSPRPALSPVNQQELYALAPLKAESLYKGNAIIKRTNSNKVVDAKAEAAASLATLDAMANLFKDQEEAH